MNQRNQSLDWMKLALALMVVGIHSNFLATDNDLFRFLSSEGLFRIAVPIFLIVNGYFFCRIKSKQQYHQWLIRLSLMYCFWMLIYSYFWANKALNDSPHKIIEIILFGYAHLWYLPAMLLAAVIYKSLIKLPQKVTTKLAFSAFIIGVIVQYANIYQILPPMMLGIENTYLHRNALLLAFPFFYLGILIKKQRLCEKIAISKLKVTIAIGVGLLLIETYANFLYSPESRGYDNNLSLVIICPLIFILFNNKQIVGTSKNIAYLSSSIYFIHPLVISIIRKFYPANGTELTMIVIIVSILSTFLLIPINQKFKIVL